MAWCANSIPTLSPLRQNYEAAYPWSSFEPTWSRKQAGRIISGSRGSGSLPMASAEALRGDPICRFGTQTFETRLFAGRLYCTERALWKLNWFLRDFGYDAQLLKDDQVDEKALSKLRGVVRTSYTTLNGRSYQNLDAFAPEADWEALDCTSLAHSDGQGGSDGL
jgi:hypothetical protein